MSFVPMSRESYRNKSFLDPRASRMGPHLYTVNFDDLLLYEANSPSHSAPIHYILHTALCCSTLLARYLDLVSLCHVLREPNLLAILAAHRPDGFLDEGMMGRRRNNKEIEEWRQQLSLGLKLLGRTYSTNEVVIIKVNDVCNVMGPVLVSGDVRSKIVFLYVEMRTFLLSVLKSRERRTWLRRRLVDNRLAASMFPSLAAIDIANLTDAQGGAFLWLINSAICNRLREGVDSDRVLPLNGERVAETPREALRVVTDFLGLPLEESKLDEILVHPSVSKYSKNLSHDYNTDSRRSEVQALEVRLGEEVNKGIEWAQKIKTDSEFSAA